MLQELSDELDVISVVNINLCSKILSEAVRRDSG